MHVSDALVSTPVALAAGALSACLLGLAGYKVNQEKNSNIGIVSLMGVLGAFIFAAQMINFTIPGTGSSGHIIGGILLAAFLGPWAAFITLSSVIIIQCLIFADGGMLALGCNILNMAAMSTLVAYPLVFRPIAGHKPTSLRISIASIAASIIGLEIGAVGVTLETMLSGISALPFKSFLSLMTGIHLLIGLGEGLATAAILTFVMKSRPDLLFSGTGQNVKSVLSIKKILILFGVGSIVLGGGLAFFASEYPDGLEWSIAKLTGDTQLSPIEVDSISEAAEQIQSATSVMPDYNNSLSGIVGALLVLVVVWCFTYILTRKKTKPAA